MGRFLVRRLLQSGLLLFAVIYLVLSAVFAFRARRTIRLLLRSASKL